MILHNLSILHMGIHLVSFKNEPEETSEASVPTIFLTHTNPKALLHFLYRQLLLAVHYSLTVNFSTPIRIWRSAQASTHCVLD